jgi:hypothetical protein
VIQIHDEMIQEAQLSESNLPLHPV